MLVVTKEAKNNLAREQWLFILTLELVLRFCLNGDQ